MVGSIDLNERVAAVAERLTPTERRIASLVLDEPALLAFGTVAEVAERAEVSGPSIVRFATKIGFDGYSSLQEKVREGISQQLFRPTDRIRRDVGPALVAERAIMTEAIDSVFEVAKNGRLEALAHSVSDATAVWIMSGETSRVGAFALSARLGVLRPRVRMLEEWNLATDLVDASTGDVAVIFDFFRYRRTVVNAARALDQAGVEVHAVTDDALSPLVASSAEFYPIRVPAVGPFDTAVSAVAFADLLIAEVANQLRDAATERVDRTEDLWSATGTFYTET